MAGDEIQQIKDRLNIVDVVGQYVQLRRAGRNYTARCPFHKERTPSFHVSPERGTYMCFGCGEKGDIFSFVERIEGSDFRTVLLELAKKAGVELHQDHTRKPENTEKDARLREVCEVATAFYESTILKREDVLSYLTNRAVSDDSRTNWRLGYAPASWQSLCDHLVALGCTHDEIVEAGLAARSQKDPARIYDRFRGRIMFPICDAQGRVVAFSGRFFEDMPGKESTEEPAKYVNSPETALFKKSRILYGLDKAKGAIRKADCILLVEGQFDVVLAHQSGLPFTVALSGTALTPEHLSLLGKISKRLVVALDGDAAGIRSGLKSSLMAIAAGFDVKVPTFPQGKDPADLAKENPELLKAAIRTSKTAVEFFMDMLRVQAKDERMYKKLVEMQVLPLIKVMQSKIEQEHFIHLVAQRLGVSETAVREEVAKQKVSLEITEVGEDGASTSTQPAHDELTAMEKKIAMLYFVFGPETPQQQKLVELLGQSYIDTFVERIAEQRELWRFRFETEINEQTSEAQIAADMLGFIERAVAKERVKSRYM
ncbi:MAG: primase [Patescibacteria group bacterium]|jgi:DNA primase|nr:primase [Patescibacteria group bacterium]